MSLDHLTDQEIALRLAQALHTWRVDPHGAGMTQVELSRKSGVGLTPLKRFEKTGGTTLLNLVAMFRGLDLLDRLEDLVPKPGTPSPLDILAAERKKTERRRAPRTRTHGPKTASVSTNQSDEKGAGDA